MISLLNPAQSTQSFSQSINGELFYIIYNPSLQRQRRLIIPPCSTVVPPTLALPRQLEGVSGSTAHWPLCRRAGSTLRMKSRFKASSENFTSVQGLQYTRQILVDITRHRVVCRIMRTHTLEPRMIVVFCHPCRDVYLPKPRRSVRSWCARIPSFYIALFVPPHST